MLKTVNKNIRQLSLSELEQYFVTMGEQKFRAKQVYEWLWLKQAHSFEAMTNLSKELRTKLAENFSLPALTVDATQYSADGTIKSRFRTQDRHLVEGVLIPTDERKTACVSSQIGCSLSCKFCATGYMDRKRNLEFDEIYDEVVLINQQCERVYNKKLSNIVFMGMGEPLLNYKNVLQAIERISSPDGLGMSPRRITVSTAGVAKMIKIYRQVPADLVNIIEYNPIDAARYEKPEEATVQQFMNYLERNRVNARLRRSRGKDIDAACGQLANKDQEINGQ
jgi:23S rRNA (adenine2503-C2)-methyltransferase